MSTHHSAHTTRRVFLSCALLSCALLTPQISISTQQNAQSAYDDVYFEAACRGDVYTLKVIALTKGLYKGINAEGRTLLHEAAQRGNEVLVDYLITQDFALNTQDKHGDTPLLLAVKNKHTPVASKLLAKGAYATTADNTGRTPLHVALENQSHFRALIPTLINNGANVNAQDKHGVTPLMVYASNASFGWGTSRSSLKQGEKAYALAQLLLSKGARVNVVDAQGQTALHKALAHGINKAAALLIDAGAQVTIQDKKGMTALHCITYYEHLPLKSMLQKGAQINARDKQGDTPAHKVADLHHFTPELLTLLKQHGANINAANNVGQTPLHIAAKLKHEWHDDSWGQDIVQDAYSTVETLLNLGANRNAQDKQGKKPIDLAWSDEVKALLRVKNSKK